jgi:hypothetical protein
MKLKNCCYDSILKEMFTVQLHTSHFIETGQFDSMARIADGKDILR